MTSACKKIPLGTAGVRINLLAQQCNPATGKLENVPLGDAAAFLVFLRSPSGELIVREGDLTTDGADALFGYTLQAGDIVEPGKWYAEGSFEKPAGTGPFPTSIADFEVFRPLYPLNLVGPSPAVLDFIAPP